MPESKEPDTTVLPVRSDTPLYHSITPAAKKSLADLGLEKVSFAYLDGEGNLRIITPIIGHETLNETLTLLEEGEIG